MILENESTFLGGLWADAKRILSTIAGVAVLTAFSVLLIAPLLEPLIASRLYDRANSGTKEEMLIAQRQLKKVRTILWVICILAWSIVIATYSGLNLYGY